MAELEHYMYQLSKPEQDQRAHTRMAAVGEHNWRILHPEENGIHSHTA